MDSSEPPLSERVATSFTQLSSAASELNSASNEIGQVVAGIDNFIQGLNLGIPTWEVVAQGDSHTAEDDPTYWIHSIGYAKVNGKWGIALKTTHGDYRWPERESSDTWLFGEAPRWLRVKSVAKLPDLIDELVKKTQAETTKIKHGIAQATELLGAIERATRTPAKPTKKGNQR